MRYQTAFASAARGVYQPQVMSGGEIIGAEALLRWRHPHRGVVSPSEFIPIAEQTGLIVALGLQALTVACEVLVTWSQRVELAYFFPRRSP